jgi:NADP-dependent 3-hydroxy acid dehydrogenase YdfG
MSTMFTAVVTGAGSGIGRAMASALSDRGHRVCLADVDRDAIESLATELPDAAAVVTDVADPDAMESLAAVTGAPGLLCLNAGVVSTDDMGAPWDASPEEWQRVMSVNVGGVVNGLRSYVPAMRAESTRSHVLITASLAGAATWPGGGPYAASKHAVLAIAEQAALSLADSSVSVTVLCPALVRTAMSPQGEDPLEIASEALAAVDAGRFAVVAAQWHAAVLGRADILVSGARPVLPTPTPSAP